MDPGDVVIVLQQEAHDVFQRSGDNLVIKHKINLVESLCGFQLVITHLDGRKVVLNHPANDPIAPETYRCVKGQGMINMKTHESGDLIIQFDVEFPTEKSLVDLKVRSFNGSFSSLSFVLCFRRSNRFSLNDPLSTFRKVNTSKKLI